MKIQAIIFDMDGVLIDARDWHYEALNRALKIFGFEISRQEHIELFDGLPTKAKLNLLSQDRGLPLRLHSFINELKQQFTVELIYQKCRPTFNHEYALARLSQSGYRLAVASNSIRSTIDLMMEKAHLEKFLEFVLSNEDVKTAKPDPEIYLLAMQKLGLKPEECLILEDNPHGLEAARQSGAHVMKIENPGSVTWDSITSQIERIENA